MLLTLLGRAGTHAIVKWRTRSGIRRTSPADTLSVDCEACTNLATEGGIDRVEFSVVANGGSPTVVTVSAMSLRKPNYSSQNSYLPGVASGMAPFWGYGTTLDCNALAAGTVVVTATAYSVAGTATELPGSITLYNDKDGTDRRPSTKQIFCSPSGNDGNDGLSRGAPKLSIVRAIEAARANPAGSTSADFDCGGAEVVLVAGAHEWAGGSYSVDDWHTSGAWWLTVTLESGATLTPAGSYPARYLTCRGYSSGGTCRIRFVGGTWTGCGGGVVFVPSGVAGEVWADGLLGQSEFWDSGTPYSVRFSEDNAEFFTLDTGGGSGTLVRYASCVRKRGCTTAFHGWTDVHDVLIENWLGVAMQAVGAEDGSSALNVLFTGNRYTTGVAGWADWTGGANLSVTIPSAGQMRIDATSAPSMDFAAGFAELAGTSFWGCKTGGFPTGANNGTFPILSTGTNGSGFPYVIVTNASAVVEVGGGSAYVVTAKISNQGRYIDEVHGDVLQFNYDRTGCVYSHIRVEDATNVQVIATNGHDLTRCAFIEWGDAAATGQRWNFTDTSLTDCLILHCTSVQSFDATGSPETFTGTEIIECVIGTSSNFPAGVARDCHFIAGGTSGTGATSGAWFAGSTTVDPWSLLPADSSLDSATGLVPYPSAWRWSGATGDTRGCSRAVGFGNWSMFPGFDLGSASAGGAGTLSPSIGLYRDLGTVPLDGSGTAYSDAGLYLSLSVPFDGGSSFSVSSALPGVGLETSISIASTFSGSSSATADASVFLGLSALCNGLSTIGASLTASTPTPLVASFSGNGELIATLRIQISEQVQRTPLMHQRIYNALKSLALEGPYYACTVNPKTGQMTIDQSKPLAPQGVVVYPLNSVFRPTAHWRQALASERTEWNWVVRIEFPSVQVAFEAWEESLIDRDITIPDVVGFNSTRTLLARLLTAEYNPPPEASPNRGTVAEFAFQINPISLRK